MAYYIMTRRKRAICGSVGGAPSDFLCPPCATMWSPVSSLASKRMAFEKKQLNQQLGLGS